jgi:hypothetical protein
VAAVEYQGWCCHASHQLLQWVWTCAAPGATYSKHMHQQWAPTCLPAYPTGTGQHIQHRATVCQMHKQTSTHQDGADKQTCSLLR